MARKSATAKAADATATAQAATKARKGIMISVTPTFAEFLTNAAQGANVSVSVYAGRLMAQACGTAVSNVVPMRAAKAKKYASKADAKAAQAAAAKKRNATMAALLKALKAGEISNDVLAKWAKSA